MFFLVFDVIFSYNTSIIKRDGDRIDEQFKPRRKTNFGDGSVDFHFSQRSSLPKFKVTPVSDGNARRLLPNHQVRPTNIGTGNGNHISAR